LHTSYAPNKVPAAHCPCPSLTEKVQARVGDTRCPKDAGSGREDSTARASPRWDQGVQNRGGGRSTPVAPLIHRCKGQQRSEWYQAHRAELHNYWLNSSRQDNIPNNLLFLLAPWAESFLSAHHVSLQLQHVFPEGDALGL